MSKRILLGHSLSLVLLALTVVSVQAQTPADNQTPTPKINIIIDRNLVRFAAPSEVQEWRLEVFTQTGEQVFNSEVVAGQPLDWPLQNQQGQPVESGLYAYTLTIKDQDGESSRTQRGHVIVDRASSSDRVWITSSSEIGVGTPTTGEELTVVGASESTVGGAKLPGEDTRTTAESGTNKPNGKGDQPENIGNLAVNVSGTGIANRLPKWTSSTEIGNSIISESGGLIGIGTGTTSPKANLHVASGRGFNTPHILIQQTNSSDYARLRFIGGADASGSGAPPAPPPPWDIAVRGSQMNFYLDGRGDVMYLNRFGLRVDGLTSTKVLQITGGADLSENFEVKAALDSDSAASPQQVQPGMVVSVDPDNPGKLVVSSQAYDRRVAGIISGAGGIKPGMLMSQAGSVADGDYPVALTGRVYCWADASNGSITPGDLLTTSGTPGRAMKVTNHVKAQGAIIGKAMSSLNHGTGLVLVLVNLQ